MATATRLTVEQYHELTEEGDRAQLIDGAIVMDEPRFSHGVLQGRVLFALEQWRRGPTGQGVVIPPTGVVMDEHNVFGPDIIWYSDPQPPLSRRGYPEVLPGICVEVRSPTTWRFDIGIKKRVFEAGGLPELWLVDNVAETVLVFRRSAPEVGCYDVALELAAGEVIESPQLIGFRLAVDELFADSAP